MNVLPKPQTKKLIISIVLIVAVSALYTVYKTKFVVKKDIEVLEIGQESRWTPESYEKYKLNKTAIVKIIKSESDYVNNVKAVDLVNELKKSNKEITSDDVALIKSEARSLGLIESDLITKKNLPTKGLPTKSLPIKNAPISPISPISKDKVLGASTNALSTPQIGTRDVPSIGGGNVNKYTGSVNYNYSIQMPPIRGNAGVGVSLNYSSRSIDDMRTNILGYSNVHPDFYNGRRCEQSKDEYGRPINTDLCYKYWDDLIFQNNIGTVGLGWNLSSFGNITIDSEYENEYVLSVGGQNVRIKEENGKFFTYPSNKFLIERYGQWGAWKVTDTSGNVYFFGSIDNDFANKVKPNPVNNSTPIPVGSANEYMAGWRYGDDTNRTRYCYTEKVAKWNLSRISDIHGNTVEIDYNQDTYQIINGCYQTANTRPTEVKYNYSEEESKYLSRVLFDYETNDIGNAWTNIKNATNFSHWTTALYFLPYSNTKTLKKVNTYNESYLINSYQLGYTKSFKNPKWKFDCPYHASPDLINYCYINETGDGEKVRQLLLTSIIKKGFDGKGEQRPITFCYKSLKNPGNPEICNGANSNTVAPETTPNDIYLVSFDNGYGGKVEYNYEHVDNITKVCGPNNNIIGDSGKDFNKNCFNNGIANKFVGAGAYLTDYYRVKNVIAGNGLGQEKKTDYIYKGESFAYVSNFGRDYIGQYPGVNKKILALKGIQFLGFPQVQLKVTDKANSSKILSNIQSYTYQTVENDKCIMVDPRYGSEYKSEILNVSDKVIGFTDNNIFTRQNLSCKGDPRTWGELEVYSRGVYSELDGKKTKQETFYDFDIYGDTADAYGNAIKSINYGNPDKAGDEIYSFSFYLTPDRFTYYQSQNLIPKDLKFSDYLAKNLISLNSGSFTTATDFAKPEDVPAEKRLNSVRNLYDQRLSEWGYQTGISGVRGLLSQVQNTYFGNNPSDLKTENTLNTYIAYNKYGLQVRTASPSKQKSYTFYETKLNLIPTCSVVVSSEFITESDKQSQSTLCDITKDKSKKMVQKLNFNNDEAIFKQLPNSSEDTNGARTSYKFDEYGRVTEIFSPNPNTPFKSLDFPSQQAFYYDSLTPMRTRIQATSLLPNGSKVNKIADTFLDGFGNAYQSINYNNLDKNGEYGVISYQEFNGVGQVTKKVGGVPVRNLQPATTPQLVDKDTLNLNLASTEETTYDYFSRPTQVTIKSGGENGSPITKTIQTSFGGYQVTATDAVGNQVKRLMDGLGREIKTTNYLCVSDTNCTETNGKPIEINTEYDILGNPLKIKDSNKITIKTAVYNTASMPLQVTDSDRGVSKLYYDDFGRVAKAVDDKGNTVENVFDGFGRVIKTSVKSKSGNIERESTNQYDTDKIGLLYKSSLKGQVSNTQNILIQEVINKYNVVGAPIETTSKTINANSIKSTPTYITKIDTNKYNDTGLLLSTQSILAGDKTPLDSTTYDYKKDLSINSITDNTTNKQLIKNIVSDYKGQVLSYNLGGVMDITQSFDNESKLLKKDTKAGTDLIDSLLYTYNSASNIAKFDSNNAEESKTYTYDSFSRLKTVNGQYIGEYKISDVGALNYKKEGANLTETTFVSDLIQNNSNPCSDNNYVSTTGYNATLNSCPYHSALYSTINGNKVTYLYDKNGNMVKTVNSDGSFTEYKYGVLDLPLEIAEYSSATKVINLTRFVYGMGGQRIGKIGRVVENFNYDLNKDGVVDSKDAQIFVSELLNNRPRTSLGSYSIVELSKIIDEWKK